MRAKRPSGSGIRQVWGPVLVVTIISFGPVVLSPLGLAQPSSTMAADIAGESLQVAAGRVDRLTTAPDTTIVFSPLENDRGISLAVPKTLKIRDPKSGRFSESISVLGEGKYAVTDGRISFDPYQNFRGKGTEIDYRSVDSAGHAVQSTFSITVSEKYLAAPVLITTQRNKKITFSPLSEPKTTVSGEKLILIDPADKKRKSTVALPGQGVFSAAADGEISFTPAPNFTGSVSKIAYGLAAEPALLPNALISLRVLAPAPVARDDEATLAPGEVATISVLANDRQESAGQRLQKKSVVLADPVTGAFKGMLVIPDEGRYAVRPSGEVEFAPNAGFTGATRALTYRAADQAGAEATAKLRFIVTQSAGPKLGADAAQGMFGASIAVKPLLNDLPGESGAALLADSLELQDPITKKPSSAISIPGEGKYQVNSDQVIFSPERNFRGQATALSYQVRDTAGLRAEAELIVTVLAPPVARADRVRVPQGSAATIAVLRNDQPGAAPLAKDSLALLTEPDAQLSREVAIPGEGTYSISDGGEIVFTPLDTFTGMSTPIRYRISDTFGVQSFATAAASVIAVVPEPIADAAATSTDTPVTIPILANDKSGNARNPLDPASVRILDPEDGINKSAIDLLGQGRLEVNQKNGDIRYTPDANFSGSAKPLTILVADKNGTARTSRLSLKVAGAAAPVAVPDIANTFANTAVTIPVLGNDLAGSAANSLNTGSVGILDLLDNTYKTSVTSPGEGTYVVVPGTGEIVFTPASGYVGTTSPQTYRVADSAGVFATATVTVKVAAPAKLAPDNVSTKQTVLVVVDVLANDLPGTNTLDSTTVALKDPSDSKFKNSVTISGVGTFALTPGTGQVTFTPNPGFFGTAGPITYQVKDSSGAAYTSTLTIDVTEVTPPDAVDDMGSTKKDVNAIVNVVLNDIRNDSALNLASIVLVTPGTGALVKSLTVPNQGTYTVNGALGTVTFDPLPSFIGAATPVSYQISDSLGISDRASISITVTALTPPDARDDTPSTSQNAPKKFNPLANDIGLDVPLDPQSVKLIDPISGALVTAVNIPGEGGYVVDPATGEITFTPLQSFASIAQSISYRVTDDAGATDTAKITFTVTSVIPRAADDLLTTPADTNVQVSVLTNDLAGNAATPLVPGTVKIFNPSSNLFDTSLTIAGQGRYTAAGDGTITFDPEPGFSGPTTPVTYQVADTNGTADTAAIRITVEAPAAGSPRLVADNATTNQGVPVPVSVLGNDLPGSSGAPLDPTKVTLKNPIDGTFGTAVTVAGEGQYSVSTTGVVTFIPLAGFTGATTEITYRVFDKAGKSSTTILKVKVRPDNPPVLTADSATTVQGKSLSLPILANDVAGAAPIVITSVELLDPSDSVFKSSFSIAGEGTYAVQSDGRVLFTPAPSFTGSGTQITYRVEDTAGVEATTTLRILVTPVTPTAADDSETTPSGVPVTIEVLANDSSGNVAIPFVTGTLELFDVDSGEFTTVVVVPGEGRYAVGATGQVVFTPETGFAGRTGALAYRIANTNGAVVSATIKVIVSDPGAPTLTKDSATTSQAVAVTVPLLGNDSPGSGTFEISSIQLKNPVTNIYTNFITVAGEGTYSVLATGEARFVPDPAFVGTAKPVTYRVLNSLGLESTSTLTMKVTAAVVGPKTSDDTGTTKQGQSVNVNVTLNDIPGSAALDPSSILLKDPATGFFADRVSVANIGEYRVNYISGQVRFTPVAAFSGMAPAITYQISDANALSSTAKITIEVTEIKPVAVADSVSTLFGTAVPVPVLDNDDAGDPSAPLAADSVLIKDPVDGVFKNNIAVAGAGTYAVTGAGVITFTPESGVSGPMPAVRYQVLDSNGTAATADLTITVANPGAPTAAADKAATLQGISVDIKVTLNDTVGDAPFNLGSLKFIGPASTSPSNVFVANIGTWTIPAPGVVRFTPLPGYTGTTPAVNYQIADDNNQTATAAVTVNVTSVKPIAKADTASTQVNKPVKVVVLANDAPGNAAVPLDGKTVELKQSDGSFSRTLTIAGQGVYTADPVTGEITFTPAAGYSGSATPVTYQIKDANGTAGTATLTVTVAQPPRVKADSVSTLQGIALTVNLLANDLPGDAPIDPASIKLIDPVTAQPVLIVDIPGQGKYELTGAPGNVTFTPVASYTGPGTSIGYTVADTAGLTAQSTIVVAVTGVAPVAAMDNVSTRQGVAVQIRAFDNDAPGNGAVPLVESSVKLLDNGVFGSALTVAGEGKYQVDPATGIVTFTPEAAFSGSATPVTYQIADKNGTAITAEIRVTVNPPVVSIAVADNATSMQGLALTVVVLKNDSDGDDPLDPATVVLEDPADATFKKTVTIPGQGTYAVQASGSVKFTPVKSFTGPATSITYRVSDTAGKAVSSTLTIKVTAGTPPIAVADLGQTFAAKPVTINVLANDTPGSASLDVRTVQLRNPADASLVTTLTIPGEGEYRVNAIGTVTFTPSAGFLGLAAPVTYRVEDALGNSAENTLRITVNDYPAPAPKSDAVLGKPGQPVIVNPLTNDISGGPALVPASVVLKDPDDGRYKKSITIPGQGTYRVDSQSGQVMFSPVIGFFGPATPVTYRVTDASGKNGYAKIAVTISVPPPGKPKADSITANPGERVIVYPVRNDVPPKGAKFVLNTLRLIDPLTGLTAVNVTVKGQGTWVLDAKTGAVTFIPEAKFTSSPTPMAYVVRDSLGGTSRSRIVISVAPAATGASPTTVSASASSSPAPTATAVGQQSALARTGAAIATGLGAAGLLGALGGLLLVLRRRLRPERGSRR